MSSFKNLEMADAVSAYRNITIKKTLFGTKAIYEPTQSRVRALVRDYSAAEGERLERMLNLPVNKLIDEINRKGKPQSSANGNFKLEACLSDDHQFCALQLLRFYDYNYHPLFEPRFYEGNDVEFIAKLL